MINLIILGRHMRHLHNLSYVALGIAFAVACGGGDKFSSKDTNSAGGTASGTGGTGGSSGSNGATDGGVTDASTGGAPAEASTGGAGTGGGATMDANTGGGTVTTDSGVVVDSGGTVVMEVGPLCNDADNDGFTTCEGDCDDSDPTSYPGGVEICGDNADNDCNMVADDTCNGFGTFVSALTGDDSNPGTQTMPVRTIAAGIQRALTIGGGPDVYVAQGQYDEKVTLQEDVSLLGGYDCAAQPCTWTRDINANTSEIVDTDVEGVLAGHQISRVTIVDGFTIQGMDTAGSSTAPGTAAMTLLGGAPTITRNTITGGALTAGSDPYDRAVGIAVLTQAGASTQGPLIDSNNIKGGQSANGSVGVLFDARPSVTGFTYGVVTRNVIRGGDARSTYGVMAWTSDASVLVEQNDIAGGASAATTEAASWGIQVGGAMTISKNRINIPGNSSASCTTVTNWCGGITSESSTTTITNNVIFGANSFWSAGVSLEETERPAGNVILNANYIDGGGTAGTLDISAAVRLRIGACNTCGFVGRIGNVRNNVLAGGTGANRSGVLEDPASGKQEHPAALENNLFFLTAGTGAALYRYNDGTTATATKLTTIDQVNALGNLIQGLPASNNQADDPKVDSTFHLTSGSPCIDKGISTEAPPDDFDGDARPQNNEFDIGPDESVN